MCTANDAPFSHQCQVSISPSSLTMVRTLAGFGNCIRSSDGLRRCFFPFHSRLRQSWFAQTVGSFLSMDTHVHWHRLHFNSLPGIRTSRRIIDGNAQTTLRLLPLCRQNFHSSHDLLDRSVLLCGNRAPDH